MVNIKAFVKQILSDAEIINLTADKKIYFLKATGATTPYIEYEFYDENGEEWEEGIEKSTNFYLQVDIFSKGDYTDLETKIKEKLINAGFIRGSAADLYEPTTLLFHKPMRFIFTADN